MEVVVFVLMNEGRGDTDGVDFVKGILHGLVLETRRAREKKEDRERRKEKGVEGRREGWREEEPVSSTISGRW